METGIGAAINERPFVLFLLTVLVLAAIGSLLTLVTSYPRLAFLLMALVLSFAFHSAPDSLTINELYLGIVVSQRPGDLNGHDSRILSGAIKKHSSWPWAQLTFGFLFAVIVFLPNSFFFILTLFLLLTGVMYLGRKYSISKGVFGSVPR